VGLLGALTTFSTLCGQTVRLARGGQITAAAVYAVGSVLLGIGFVWLGVKLAQIIPNPQKKISDA
jgi:CrcB protein